MNDFFIKTFSWGDFLGIGLLLFVLFFALKFFQNILKKFQLLGRYQSTVSKGLQFGLLIFEPIAFLIMAAIFILINPKVHGIFSFLVILFTHDYLKNYFYGRLLSRDKNLVKGKFFNSNDEEGQIYELESFGLKIQTPKGLHFINYGQIWSKGYTLLSEENVGGFLKLQIVPQDVDAKIDHRLYLLDLLATTPFISKKQKPMLVASNTVPEAIEANITLQENHYLPALLSLIEEWGYRPKVVVNKGQQLF